MNTRMKQSGLLFLILLFLCVSAAAARDTERTVLDASSLAAGGPFRFTVTVDSDELRSFAAAQARLTAVLCPADRPAEECRVMNRTEDGEDSTSMRIVFEVDELPLAGDYTLDVSFLDVSGEFESQTAAYLLRGVQEAAAEIPVREAEGPAEAPGDTVVQTVIAEDGTGDTVVQTVISEDETGDTVVQTVIAEDETGDTVVQTVIAEDETGDTVVQTVIAEDGTGETAPGPVPAGEGTDAAVPQGPAPLPDEVRKIVLRPEVRDAAGSPMIYGSTVYVNQPYTLLLPADSPMNDSVLLEVRLPASLLESPLDPDSECLRYMDGEGTLRIPGGRWNEENGNAFSCSFRWNDRAWLAANPVAFSLAVNPANTVPVDETYEMDPVTWTNYPVNVTQYPASHQVQISDSRGNLLCSDTVPCAVFNAEDVYIFTYKFPADWGGAVGSGLDLSAEISWPAAWAFGISDDLGLASAFGSLCAPDAEGKTRLQLEETAPGRYSGSCAFVPGGVTAPVQAPALVRLDDNSFAVSDLNVWMPGRILKSEAVLTPSLELRMEENAAGAEQIRGGTIGTLYRAPADYPNSMADSAMPARYTLKADISGVSPARSPQPGDAVIVSWSLLDKLAQAGDLPSCLAPTGSGYILGSLEQAEGGGWQASCDLRFPQSMAADTPAGPLTMELVSGIYRTGARAEMNGHAFSAEKVVVDLDVPTHMLIKQPTEFHVRLTDGGGTFSDYLRAVLSYTGASLRSDWIYNYATTCQGDYLISVNGDSSCSAFFDFPAESPSDMHFSLVSPALDRLFSAEYRPSADIHIEPVTPVGAALTVKLFHAGTEVPLPASDGDAFMVSDDYQLQFYLTPDPEYRDVMNAVSVDGEGMVLDWWEPLLVRWDMIPGGQTGLNFYRDGDHFIARYDFSFSQGNIALQGNSSRLVMEPGIEGWNVRVQGDWAPIALPSRVERKPLSLSFSDFSVEGSKDTIADLHVGEEASFTISFNGSLDHYDPLQLVAGYDANGIRNPLACDPDYSAGVLRCWIKPQCTDYDVSGNYGSVCGTDLSLYAVYNGDAINSPAEAAPKTFSVKRHDIRFTPVEEGSLSKDDMRSIRAASEDTMSMGYGSIEAGEWKIDSFLPRQIRDRKGMDYCSYPVIFRFETGRFIEPDQARMFLDVTYETGIRSKSEEHVISLRPRMVTDDRVLFELDFGSRELTDEGKTVREAMEDAVTIKSLKARYAGDAQIASASAKFEAKDLTFDLKVATLFETETNLGMPNILQFTGVAASEMIMQPFMVYCSQLYQPLECSTDAPVFVTATETPVPFILPEPTLEPEPTSEPDVFFPTEEPMIPDPVIIPTEPLIPDAVIPTEPMIPEPVIPAEPMIPDAVILPETSGGTGLSEGSDSGAVVTGPEITALWPDLPLKYGIWAQPAWQTSVSLGFRDDGCWGKIRTMGVGLPMIYVNNAVDPVCYLTVWNEGRQIWIATNAEE